jgi:hypothetical protein
MKVRGILCVGVLDGGVVEYDWLNVPRPQDVWVGFSRLLRRCVDPVPFLPGLQWNWTSTWGMRN